MLYRLIIKNFRCNIRNYLLFFASNTLAVMLLLVFYGMKYNLGSTIQDEGMAYELNMDFMIATVMIAIVAILLTIYAVQHYVKLRIRDYSMLKLLGIRKKVFQKIIFAEYGLGWLLSFAVGLVCGNIVYYCFQKILFYIAPDFIAKSFIGFKAYLYTLCINTGIVFVVVLIIMTRMDGKSLDDFAAGKEMKEAKPKNKKWFGVVLIGIYVFVSANDKFPNGSEGIFYAHIMWLIAMFLILSVGGSLLLEWIKSKRRFYLKNVLKLNQLCHHYSSNYMVIFMLFAIHFFSLAYLSTTLAACFPITVDRNCYPYDFIWTAQEKDCGYIDEISEDYNCSVVKIPLIRVTALNQLDHFGISVKSYEKLTGSSLELSEDEIMVLVESQEEEKMINDKNYYLMYGAIHIGKSYGNDVSRDNYEQYGFQKTNISKIITGNIVGQLVDGWRENWIIFSDDKFEQYHEEIIKDSEEPSLLVLFKFPGQYREEVSKKLESYIKSHGVKELGALQSNFYNIDNLIKGIQSRTLFTFSSKVFLLITLLFSSLFIIAMKVMADETMLAERYRFLQCMGMRRDKHRKIVRFEVRCSGCIPLIFGILMGINYALINSYRERLNGIDLSFEFWKAWGIIVFIYIILQSIGIEVAAKSIIKRVEE